MTLAAADGRRREIKRTFTRKHFPWENATLGCERTVIPPFTPMTVNKRRASISRVLLTHELAGNGLWKQVTSQSVSLLAAPLRLEIESAGKSYTIQGKKVAFTKQEEDRVQGHAAGVGFAPRRAS